jgi:replicative DNA helicase
MWNKYTSSKYETSDQIMEFLDIADQLVFIMEILEKKDSDRIQKDAIRKVIAIATSDQLHLWESQKNHLNEMGRMVLTNIDQESIKMTLSSVLMKLANALMLPTGQGSQSNTRPEERKRKWQ